ncbi:hypothetical protein DKX38_020349 [Salix brachista]|uniref:Uncharacterized protein n=1 Tax=Salix brachista TaxID=2182728 RepID=A0A5N5K5R8_9ROSI|nr:hypothetical protein DKX38_020349 [Salix brachista]
MSNLQWIGSGQVFCPSASNLEHPNPVTDLDPIGLNMGILVLVEQKNLKSLDIEDLIYDCMEWHKGIPIADCNEYRRSVFVDLRIHIPEKLLQLNDEIRTVQATNNYDNLKFYLYFSEPVLNSSAEILNSLTTSEGVVLPTSGENLVN